VSVALALEYEAVLNRAAMREASWASKAELDVVLDALIGQARRIMPTSAWQFTDSLDLTKMVIYQEDSEDSRPFSGQVFESFSSLGQR
jgi:hypothetical protein